MKAKLGVNKYETFYFCLTFLILINNEIDLND